MSSAAGPGTGPIAAVVFDFDGVIADTERLHLEAFRHAFAPRGWPLSEEAYFDRYLGCDDRGLVVAYARDGGHDLSRDEIDTLVSRKVQAFAQYLSSPAVLFPGAEAAIRALANRFRTGIASGALHHEIHAILTAAGLRETFGVIVGTDDVASHKPSPEPYLAAAAALGIAPAQCVAIEDSAPGLQAARAAGMRTIAVTTTSPAHALGEADRIVATLADVSPDVIDTLAAPTPSR